MTDCKDIGQTLLDCLHKTDCMRNGGTWKECLSADHSPDCQVLRRTYFECKRSQLDMRTRIKGIKSH